MFYYTVSLLLPQTKPFTIRSPSVGMLRAITLLSCSWLAAASSMSPGGDIGSTPATLVPLRTGPYKSVLYQLESAGSVYQNTTLPMLIDLSASSSYYQGYDYGYLLGKEGLDNYEFLMQSLLGDAYGPLLMDAINAFLDYQWDNYLSVALPAYMVEEIAGMTAGGEASGLKRDLAKYVIT